MHHTEGTVENGLSIFLKVSQNQQRQSSTSGHTKNKFVFLTLEGYLTPLSKVLESVVPVWILPIRLLLYQGPVQGYHPPLCVCQSSTLAVSDVWCCAISALQHWEFAGKPFEYVLRSYCATLLCLCRADMASKPITDSYMPSGAQGLRTKTIAVASHCPDDIVTKQW